VSRIGVDIYEPKGYPFFDANSGRHCKLVAADEPRKELRGWLVWKHPDGQWVTWRKATADDHRRITRAIVRDHDMN
jgi:hypothetical protein